MSGTFSKVSADPYLIGECHEKKKELGRWGESENEISLQRRGSAQLRSYYRRFVDPPLSARSRRLGRVLGEGRPKKNQKEN